MALRSEQGKPQLVFLVFTYLYMMWWTTSLIQYVKAENYDSLKLGETLNATDKLCSKQGTYCVSFNDKLSSHKNLTYLQINPRGKDDWQVWVANRNQPVDADSAVLVLDHSGVLKIESNTTKEPIILYSSPQPVDNSTTMATLLDTGNFVVQQIHPNGTNTVLWQNFDYPTDTLVPGKKLGVNHKTGHNWSLVSWLGNTNPASGPFRLEWEPRTRELVINHREQVYWRSGELRNNRFKHISSSAEFQYETVSNKDEEYFILNTANEDKFLMWALLETGQLISRSRGDDIARADLCYGYNTDIEGCQKWEEIPTCRSHGDVFEMKTGYPNYDMANNLMNASYSISDCQAICWSNCSCVGFKSYDDDDGTSCTFFASTQGTNIANSGQTFYMLVKSTHHKGTNNWIWKSAIIVVALLIVCSSILWLPLKKQKENKVKRMKKEMLDLTTSNESSIIKDLEDDLKGHDIKVFNYTSILAATMNFSPENKLGQGGYGPVYKGIMPTGQEVAIKRLSKTSAQGVVEFKNELTLICELQHMNLVRLLGCCVHEEERILIYEYMPNKSLDFYIFDCTRSKLLDWKKRLNIIEGISQGLLYLHKYSRLKIIHRDLKASNILLDNNMNPKISDFGMARMFEQQESTVNTNRIVGTYGYMSPEYVMEGVFSTKSDVYSFGVLLLEIVSGRRNNSFYDGDHPVNLVGHAWELWKEGQCLQLIDPSLNDTFVPHEVQRCIHVGLLCVEQYANDRPMMSNIISMLTNQIALVTLPRRPAFYVGREIPKGTTTSKMSDTGFMKEISTSSEND